MAHSLHNIAGASLTLCTHHRRTLTDPAQSLTQIACATHKGYREQMLIDMETLISRCQHFRLVDTVHADRLQNLSLHKVTNTALSHHGNRNGCFDLNDQLGITHACNPALNTNI